MKDFEVSAVLNNLSIHKCDITRVLAFPHQISLKILTLDRDGHYVIVLAPVERNIHETGWRKLEKEALLSR